MAAKSRRKNDLPTINFEIVLVLFILLVIILLGWEYSMHAIKAKEPRQLQPSPHPYSGWMGYLPFDFW